MNIWQIIWRLVAFVRPYKGLVIASLLLTLLGAVAAQVNPLVLRYTVDTVERLLNEYYELRGWDLATGIPTKEKLIELGLDDVAAELGALGKLP